MPVQSLLSDTDRKIINAAVERELFASHLYKRVSNVMQRAGYLGAAKFFASESKDELKHYQIHADHMNAMGDIAATPALPAIADAPKDLTDAIQLGYKTETKLLAQYESWVSAAQLESTRIHLRKFIEIQVTSVGEYGDWLARIEEVGRDECGHLIVDKELGAA